MTISTFHALGAKILHQEAREPSRFIAEMGDYLKHSGGGANPPADKAVGRAKLARFRELPASGRE